MKKYNNLRKSLTIVVNILLSCTFYNSAIAAPLADLEGKAPEEATITVTVNKPANAIIGHILLNAYDADQLNEGELIINGNPAITLFGAAGVSANDVKSAYIFLRSPADYWLDGKNTLVFKHTRTGGYVIDEVRVQFEVSSPVVNDPAPAPAPAPAPSPDPSSFPVDLSGKAPEEASITINVSKPSNATKGSITLSVFDADFSDEGELIINGNKAIKLFGAGGSTKNNSKASKATFSTPASYWRNGSNTLRFKHTRTGGFAINAVNVQFEVSSPVVNDPAPASSPDPSSFPVDLSGKAPEEASITINVSKPSNATKGSITLSVFDADFSDEGELIINGNKAIKLFGAGGSTKNNSKASKATFSTPASYWRNGSNTLRFKHTRTGGFVINAVNVQFEVSSPVVNDPAPAPAPAPSPDPSSFPVDLSGKAPEEASITINVSKPSNATKGSITLSVFDADFSDEGELIINGNKAIKLFGAGGSSKNDSKSSTATFSTPASYWRKGSNTLRFKHTRTGGFVINAVNVQFEVSSPVVNDPAPAPAPAPSPDPSSFPVDLSGKAPEEASITINVSKPSNATKGSITLSVFDADFSDEGELIINGNKAIKLFGAGGSTKNNSKASKATFSTPASYWRNGSNTLRFKHTRTGGFVINAVDVQFDTGGGSAPAGTGSVNLSWVAPVERADNTALAVNDIAGYTVYYGTAKGSYTNSFKVNNSSTTSATVSDLPTGTYYMVVTTRDTGGRESSYSSMVAKQSQ